MPISKQTYDELKRRFGDCASWAIWKGWTNKEDLGPEIFRDESALLSKLNDKYVFVGLNPSGTEEDNKKNQVPWRNFHSIRGNDGYLAFALQGTRYQGSYITDFFKYRFTGDSGTLDWSETNIEDAVRKLKEEIAILGNVEIVFVLGKTKEKRLEPIRNQLKVCFPKLRKVIFLTHFTYPARAGNKPLEWYRDERIYPEIRDAGESFP